MVGHGFCQAIVGRNNVNISRILENIVFIELLTRGWDVKIGKIGDYEIDFVCQKFDKIYRKLIPWTEMRQLKWNSDHCWKLKIIFRSM